MRNFGKRIEKVKPKLAPVQLMFGDLETSKKAHAEEVYYPHGQTYELEPSDHDLVISSHNGMK